MENPPVFEVKVGSRKVKSRHFDQTNARDTPVLGADLMSLGIKAEVEEYVNGGLTREVESEAPLSAEDAHRAGTSSLNEPEILNVGAAS